MVPTIERATDNLSKMDEINFNKFNNELIEIRSNMDKIAETKLFDLDRGKFSSELKITRKQLAGELARKSSEMNIKFRTKAQLSEVGDDPISRLKIENQAHQELLALKLKAAEQERAIKRETIDLELAAQIAKINIEKDLQRDKITTAVEEANTSVAAAIEARKNIMLGAVAMAQVTDELSAIFGFKLPSLAAKLQAEVQQVRHTPQEAADNKTLKNIENERRDQIVRAKLLAGDKKSELDLKAEYERRHIALDAADEFRTRVHDAGEAFKTKIREAEQKRVDAIRKLGDDIGRKFGEALKNDSEKSRKIQEAKEAASQTISAGGPFGPLIESIVSGRFRGPTDEGGRGSSTSRLLLKSLEGALHENIGPIIEAVGGEIIAKASGPLQDSANSNKVFKVAVDTFKESVNSLTGGTSGATGGAGSIGGMLSGVLGGLFGGQGGAGGGIIGAITNLFGGGTGGGTKGGVMDAVFASGTGGEAGGLSGMLGGLISEVGLGRASATGSTAVMEGAVAKGVETGIAKTGVAGAGSGAAAAGSGFTMSSAAGPLGAIAGVLGGIGAEMSMAATDNSKTIQGINAALDGITTLASAAGPGGVIVGAIAQVVKFTGGLAAKEGASLAAKQQARGKKFTGGMKGGGQKQRVWEGVATLGISSAFTDIVRRKAKRRRRRQRRKIRGQFPGVVDSFRQQEEFGRQQFQAENFGVNFQELLDFERKRFDITKSSVGVVKAWGTLVDRSSKLISSRLGELRQFGKSKFGGGPDAMI
jgi:hypothetical protein